MAFPEGKNDWFAILRFLIKLIEVIGETFFGGNPNGKTKSGD